MKTKIIAVLLPALLALGCAPGLADARSAVNTASRSYEAVRADVADRYEQAQLDCLTAPPPPEPCVARVRADWGPAKAAVLAFRRAVSVAQALIRAAEASAALGRGVSVPRLLSAAGVAVDAGERVAEELIKLDAPKPGRVP